MLVDAILIWFSKFLFGMKSQKPNCLVVLCGKKKKDLQFSFGGSFPGKKVPKRFGFLVKKQNAVHNLIFEGFLRKFKAKIFGLKRGQSKM